MDELKHLVLETGKQLHPEKQFKAGVVITSLFLKNEGEQDLILTAFV